MYNPSNYPMTQDVLVALLPEIDFQVMDELDWEAFEDPDGQALRQMCEIKGAPAKIGMHPVDDTFTVIQIGDYCEVFWEEHDSQVFTITK